MMMLNEWARRHCLPPSALVELAQILGAGEPTLPHPQAGQSEAAIQQLVRLEVAQRGNRVWRNNSGAAQDLETGRIVRYGLGNDSAKVCEVMKSSDLIGITRRPECGCGVFTAYEAKKPGWKFRPSDKRASAQLNFMNLVVSLGGIGRFVTSPEDVV